MEMNFKALFHFYVAPNIEQVKNVIFFCFFLFEILKLKTQKQYVVCSDKSRLELRFDWCSRMLG